MKAKTSSTRNKIENILDIFNKNCEAKGLKEQFKLKYETLTESITIENQIGTVEIGRLTLTLLKLDEERLSGLTLYKRDFPITKIGQKANGHWEEELSRELMYEMIGNFCMITRGMMLEQIKIGELNKLNSDIQAKINAEEDAIVNKPEAEKTEEDIVASMLIKTRKKKIQKTGLLDRNGTDILSQTEE